MNLNQQLQTTQTQIEETFTKLETLKSELSTFEQLVIDNQQLEASARASKDFDALVHQKSKTGAATEILDEHQNEILSLEERMLVLKKESHFLQGLINIKELETKMNTVQSSYETALLSALEETLRAFEEIALFHSEWFLLRQQFHNEFTSLFGVGWTKWSHQDPDHTGKIKLFNQGRDALMDAGISWAVLTTLPDGSKGLINENTAVVEIPEFIKPLIRVKTSIKSNLLPLTDLINLLHYIPEFTRSQKSS